MARIVWSFIARDDLKALVAFIKADSPGYAHTFGFRTSPGNVLLIESERRRTARRRAARMVQRLRQAAGERP